MTTATARLAPEVFRLPVEKIRSGYYGDGWAAHVAGAIGVSTDAQASWWGGRELRPNPRLREVQRD